MTKFNEWLATHVVSLVGTMWCTYSFLLLVMIPLFKPDWQLVVLYISSTVLQLVLLPLILVGQSVVERRTEQRANEDHEALKEILADIREAHEAMHKKIRLLKT